MKRVYTVPALVLMLTGLGLADMATFKATYEEEMEAIVLSHGMKVTALGQEYVSGCDALLATVKKDGSLEKTTVVLEEISRFGREKRMPDKPSSLLDLQNLQAAYAKKEGGVRADISTRIVTLTSQYDQALRRLQEQLVSADRLDDAKAVREERKRVQESEILVSAKSFLAEYAKAASASSNRTTSPTNTKNALASITPTAGFTEVADLRNRSKAWANRSYIWMNIPPGLPVTRFAMIPGGSQQSVKARVESPGYAYIAYGDPRHARLKLQGWRPTGDSFAYSDKNSTQMHVLRKKVGVGRLEIPNLSWSGPVLLLP